MKSLDVSIGGIAREVVAKTHTDDLSKLAYAYLEAVSVLKKYINYRAHDAIPGTHALPEEILLGMYKVIDEADGVDRGGWNKIPGTKLGVNNE